MRLQMYGRYKIWNNEKEIYLATKRGNMKKSKKEMKIAEMQERIRRTVEKMPGLKKRELMRRLKVKDREIFYAALDDLRRSGEICENKSKQKIGPSSKKGKTVRAEIVSLSKGFAFAQPEDGASDIFVQGYSLDDVMVGDIVRLRGLRDSEKGPYAELDSIEERAPRVSAGTIVEENGEIRFRPDLPVRYRMSLTKDSLRVRVGDKVMAELVMPRRQKEYRARIVKRYGSAENASVCVDAILEQNGIAPQFPESVVQQADCVASEKIDENVLKDRLDLRKRMICTIDGADARDLDDAISVTRTKTGYRLGVHIADVSHYVREGSCLDEEALRRGTSVYFPDRVVPMLPAQLSNGVCSLNAGEDKLTLSALIDFDSEGVMLSYRFRKSVIRSRVRGVYSEVNSIFSGTADSALKKKYSPVIRSLHAARELAKLLEKRAAAQGKIDFETTEPEFTLDDKGMCVDMRPHPRGEAEEMIEQLMIAANRAAAALAREKGLPFVYRVHEQPSKDRVDELIRLAGMLGVSAKDLDGANPTPAGFAAFLEKTKGTKAEQILGVQTLRTMEKARYLPEPKGHFGLALADYCHYTSPIRRYPDTAVHRILSAYLSGVSPQQLESRFSSFVQNASKQSSKREIVAMNAERMADDCFMAEYMRAHIGEEFDGVISGVTARGVFVQLSSGAEGFAPIESFENARLLYDGVFAYTDEVTGRQLTIGQPLRILVASADVATGRVDFVPVDWKG